MRQIETMEKSRLFCVVSAVVIAQVLYTFFIRRVDKQIKK
jgi:hypothetical protein